MTRSMKDKTTAGAADDGAESVLDVSAERDEDDVSVVNDGELGEDAFLHIGQSGAGSGAASVDMWVQREFQGGSSGTGCVVQ